MNDTPGALASDSTRGKAEIKRPELLAPAGSLLAGVAALDAGADAVYFGLGNFNARDRASNFSLDDASRIVSYAHKSGKKAYLALNTLIKESELELFASCLANAVVLRADAVIVQDIAAVQIAKRFFPSLKIHASTQMGIHNSPGVVAAANMGIGRVILERQTTIAEIEMILRNSQSALAAAGKSPVELEIFIHGALCCSLSGVCLFSSWIGGRSGNRGKCAQPCRRSFIDGKGAEGFFLSTKDLSLAEKIPQLRKLGISSFKIEGRLKKPDYIAGVVSAYRILIDAPDWDIARSKDKALKILSGLSSRECSAGFSDQKAISSVIAHRSAGVHGVKCGKVLSNVKDGFMAEASARIHVGDILRAQEHDGDASESLTVSLIKVEGHTVEKAANGQICFIKCDRKVPEKSWLYKTGESYSRHNARLSSLPLLKDPIPMQISISRSSIDVSALSARWHKKINLEPAKKHSISANTVSAEFAHANSATLEAGKIEVEIAEPLFIPSSVLKQLRREFWEHLSKEFPQMTFEEKRRHILVPCSDGMNAVKSLMRANQALFNKNFADKETRFSDLGTLQSCSSSPEEIILPFFCPETEISKLRGDIETASRMNLHAIFRATSLFHIVMLRKHQKKTLTLSFPFPLCNSFAVLAALHLVSGGHQYPSNLPDVLSAAMKKIKTVQAWPELEECEIRNLAENCPLPLENITDGHLPIFATRALVPATGTLKDQHGDTYRLCKDISGHLTMLVPVQPFAIPRIPGTANFHMDRHSNGLSADANPSTFNFKRAMQ